jgi:hypothetical protein
MNIEEIITNPPRDEYIDHYGHKFDHAVTVAKIKDLNLRKVQNSEEIDYGLFDSSDRLVGYFSLEYYANDIWVVTLVQLAQAYKGQGYGTFFYDYAVMNDKLKIMSDATNTDGVHGSKNLWKSLYDKRRYNIVGYDTDTDQIITDLHPDLIYNDKPNMRWLALPGAKTINEYIQYCTQSNSKRYLVLYGPGTTTEDYFNF